MKYDKFKSSSKTSTQPSASQQKNLSVYAAGTKVQTFTAFPTSFASNLILDKQALTHSSSVTYPNGTIDASIAYNSPKTMAAENTEYVKELKANGWIISPDNVTPQADVIAAEQGTAQEMIITITPQGKGSTVTAEYKKLNQ